MLEILAKRISGKGELMTPRTYVEICLKEWPLTELPLEARNSVRKVLGEMKDAALLILKAPKFEVLVVPDWHFSVWAYLVVDHKHWTARRVQLRAGHASSARFRIFTDTGSPPRNI